MIDPRKREQYFKLQKASFGRCLYPFSDCELKPINAHSIQNAKIFDLLQEGNHVIQLKSRFDETASPVLGFHPVSRNDASTFLGLCSSHDNSLFRPIDAQFDVNNDEHLFLLAYRSLLKEFHASVSAFKRTQLGYQIQVEQGLVPGENEMKDMLPITMGINAFDTYTYKEQFDKALIIKNYSSLRHHVIEFSNQPPAIACSQLFSADSVPFGDDVLRVVLNIMPVSNDRTMVIFSATKDEFALAKEYISRCLGGDEHFRKYEISKIVIRNCENFFVSPKHFRTWSDNKKKTVIDFYRRSMAEDKDEDSAEYYLF